MKVMSRGHTVGFVLLAAACLCAAPPARAELVYFEDEGLYQAVARSIGFALMPARPQTADYMERMIHLDAQGIFSLSGLEYAVNLEMLMVTEGTITDLTPIGALTSLTWVDVGRNEIRDIAPLAGLTAMEILVLDGNAVADLSAVAGLENLWWCHLADNEIQDISALACLTGLGKLYLEGNPLNAEAYDTYLPMIEANNPGLDLRYDPFIARGDADRDGRVAVEDFIILKNNFGVAGGWDEGDFDGDGLVDVNDFVILKNNFGASTVPEPAGLTLLAAGMLGAMRRCGRFSRPASRADRGGDNEQ